MANWTQGGSHFGAEQGSGKTTCAVCEAMLPDAVDGALTPEEQRAFDTHVAGCVECARELEEAQRGAAWLAMLKTQAPEPPANLLAKILAETSGAKDASFAAESLATSPMRDEAAHVWSTRNIVVTQASWGARVSGWGSRVAQAFRVDFSGSSFQPRLAMTAAMAFFSVALTLNLTGVKLHDLRAENLTPSGMRRTVADMGASASRSFQNLRVVYEVESRVSELRNDNFNGNGNNFNNDNFNRGREPEATRPQQQDEQEPVQRNNVPQNSAPKDNDAPKKSPRPQGSSDLAVPVPERVVRGGFAVRKEA